MKITKGKMKVKVEKGEAENNCPYCKDSQCKLQEEMCSGKEFNDCEDYQIRAWKESKGKSCADCYPKEKDEDGVCQLEKKCNKNNNFKYYQPKSIKEE